MRNPIPTQKLYPNWKFYPFPKHILSVFNFLWVLVCALAVDEQMIGFQGRHVNKMRISYKNKEGVFQAYDLCDQGYTDNVFLSNECTPN